MKTLRRSGVAVRDHSKYTGTPSNTITRPGQVVCVLIQQQHHHDRDCRHYIQQRHKGVAKRAIRALGIGPLRSAAQRCLQSSARKKSAPRKRRSRASRCRDCRRSPLAADTCAVRSRMAITESTAWTSGRSPARLSCSACRWSGKTNRPSPSRRKPARRQGSVHCCSQTWR